MPTAGFEPPSSGVGSNRSDNCAINTGQLHRILLEELGVITRIRTHHHQLTRIMTHHHQLTRIMTHHHQLTRFLFIETIDIVDFPSRTPLQGRTGFHCLLNNIFNESLCLVFVAYQSSQKHSIIYVDRRIHFWHFFLSFYTFYISILGASFSVSINLSLDSLSLSILAFLLLVSILVPYIFSLSLPLYWYLPSLNSNLKYLFYSILSLDIFCLYFYTISFYRFILGFYLSLFKHETSILV